MKLNNTTRTISVILGILIVLGTFIWQVSAFTTKVEYRLQKGEDWNVVQDSSIAKIDSKIDYLVSQARLKEIIDSLSQSELVIQAQKIMKNNADTNTVDTDTATVKEWSTDDLGGQ